MSGHFIPEKLHEAYSGRGEGGEKYRPEKRKPVNHKAQVNPTAVSAALTMSRSIEPPFCCQVCLFLTEAVQGNISRSRSFAPSLAELLARLLQFYGVRTNVV
jgi:hypothetical protein